jgi:hypothetical protein
VDVRATAPVVLLLQQATTVACRVVALVRAALV